MCRCTPAGSRPAARAAATACSASSGGSPNFEPSWAVRIFSCVSASIPGVTRTSTSRTPASVARSTSSRASRTTKRALASAAARSSSSLLLFPCTTMRSPGRPASSANLSSPRVETSAPKPCSASRRSTATFGSALRL
jgi:hypothetical protein